jgi:hypothetical protein
MASAHATIEPPLRAVAPSVERTVQKTMPACLAGTSSSSSGVSDEPLFSREETTSNQPSIDKQAEFDRVVGAYVPMSELPSTRACQQRGQDATATQGTTYAGVAAASSSKDDDDLLCPYHIIGECYAGDNCVMLHGQLCVMCDVHALHPTNERLRNKHIQVRCLVYDAHCLLFTGMYSCT